MRRGSAPPPWHGCGFWSICARRKVGRLPLEGTSTRASRFSRIRPEIRSPDLEHGLISMGGIWIQPLAPAVHVEIHFLQDSLADDDFVTQDDGFLVGSPS